MDDKTTKTPKRDVTLNLIYGDERTDRMMRNSGMFEVGKRYGEHACLEYTVESDKTIQQLVDAFKEQLTNAGYFVTAIWEAQHPENHYVDWSVEITSTGKKWCRLETYLNAFGIKKPETPPLA